MKLGKWENLSTCRIRHVVINFGEPYSYVIFIKIRDRRPFNQKPWNRYVDVTWNSHFHAESGEKFYITSKTGDDFSWKDLFGQIRVSLNLKYNVKARNVYEKMASKMPEGHVSLPHQVLKNKSFNKT